VSKKELGKGIPSVSIICAMVDQYLLMKDPNKPYPLLKDCQNIEKIQGSAVIFPEGTRSKTGVPKSSHKQD
jgi:1-acyl-sn-glycerol-3-phosphate acyltransferase